MTGWIQTYTGKSFYPLEPQQSKIDIVDIAHSLSMQCRYNGHVTRFYSVAEHSVILSKTVSSENALWALLHDASEAYLTDVPRPIKHLLGTYAETEKRLERVIFDHFGLNGDMPAQVKEYDHRILSDERSELMVACETEWSDMLPPLGLRIVGLSPTDARREFLNRYSELTQLTLDI